MASKLATGFACALVAVVLITAVSASQLRTEQVAALHADNAILHLKLKQCERRNDAVLGNGPSVPHQSQLAAAVGEPSAPDSRPPLFTLCLFTICSDGQVVALNDAAGNQPGESAAAERKRLPKGTSAVSLSGGKEQPWRRKPNRASVSNVPACDASVITGQTRRSANGALSASMTETIESSKSPADVCEGVPPCVAASRIVGDGAPVTFVIADGLSLAKSNTPSAVSAFAASITERRRPSDPPESNPLCAIELAAHESRANIDLSYKWAELYGEPWLRCRADAVRGSYAAFYACIAAGRSDCQNAAVQWLYDNGMPLRNLALTHIVEHVERTCPKCNALRVGYGGEEVDAAFEPDSCTTDCTVKFDAALIRAVPQYRWYCDGAIGGCQ